MCGSSQKNDGGATSTTASWCSYCSSFSTGHGQQQCTVVSKVHIWTQWCYCSAVCVHYTPHFCSLWQLAVIHCSSTLSLPPSTCFKDLWRQGNCYSETFLQPGTKLLLRYFNTFKANFLHQCFGHWSGLHHGSCMQQESCNRLGQCHSDWSGIKQDWHTQREVVLIRKSSRMIWDKGSCLLSHVWDSLLTTSETRSQSWWHTQVSDQNICVRNLLALPA